MKFSQSTFFLKRSIKTHITARRVYIVRDGLSGRLDDTEGMLMEA
jgi:hypothetical protein